MSGGASSATASSGRNGLTVVTPAPGGTIAVDGEGTGWTDGDLIDVLSGSSLNTFLRCAKQWEYAYVYRLRRPPTLRLVVGSAGHDAVRVDLQQKMETAVDLPVDDVKDLFSTAFDRELADNEDDPKAQGAAKDTGIRQISFWHQEVAPDVDPILVEEPIAFLLDGITITGTLDIVDARMRLRDWKFSQKTPSSGEAYLLNMVGYAIGFRVSTGLIESRAILDHIVGLKTKTKHVQFASEGPVPDESIAVYANIVNDTNRAIQAGIFPPTGIKSGACSWCGYRDICPAYKDSPMKGLVEDTDGT